MRVAWLLQLVFRSRTQQFAKEITMQKLLSFCVAFGLLAGCASTGSNDDGTARLPTGVKLLDSDRNTCNGVVHVDKRSVASSREIVVRPGQNAAFKNEGDRIDWTCIGQSSSNDERTSCPDRTSYVRITRPAEGDSLLVECYGG
jgi:hypothetical protein